MLVQVRVGIVVALALLLSASCGGSSGGGGDDVGDSGGSGQGGITINQDYSEAGSWTVDRTTLQAVQYVSAAAAQVLWCGDSNGSIAVQDEAGVRFPLLSQGARALLRAVLHVHVTPTNFGSPGQLQVWHYRFASGPYTTASTGGSPSPLGTYSTSATAQSGPGLISVDVTSSVQSALNSGHGYADFLFWCNTSNGSGAGYTLVHEKLVAGSPRLELEWSE